MPTGAYRRARLGQRHLHLALKRTFRCMCRSLRPLRPTRPDQSLRPPRGPDLCPQQTRFPRALPPDRHVCALNLRRELFPTLRHRSLHDPHALGNHSLHLHLDQILAPRGHSRNIPNRCRRPLNLSPHFSPLSPCPLLRNRLYLHLCLARLPTPPSPETQARSRDWAWIRSSSVI